MTDEEAAAWLENAQDRDQYKEDVFGESTASYAKTRMQARLRSARYVRHQIPLAKLRRIHRLFRLFRPSEYIARGEI